MSNTNKYKDVDISFSRHPVTKDIVKVYDELAVKQSIKTLIRTQFYDAPYQPTKGSSIRNSLFEPISPLTANVLASGLRELIDRYEPRAAKLNVEVSVASDDMSYNVVIYFSMANIPTQQKLTLILKRIR